VPGFGPQKVERYGTRFLEVLAAGEGCSASGDQGSSPP
jgi:hypothetical protein